MMRTRIAIAGLALLLLLPTPLVSAGPSCRQSYGPGTGQVWFSPYEDPRRATGNWVDACGGNKCDDHVYGDIFWGDGTSSTFLVVEVAGSNDNCAVDCQIGSSGPYRHSGWVIPSKSGDHRSVAFTCEDWYYGEDFSGSLGYSVKDTVDVAIDIATVYVSGTPPV